jgi:hypothetical protein
VSEPAPCRIRDNVTAAAGGGAARMTYDPEHAAEHLLAMLRKP